MEFTGRSPIVMLSAAGPPLRAKPQSRFPGRGALRQRDDEGMEIGRAHV